MTRPDEVIHRRTLRWQDATVLAVRDETPTARTFRLKLPALLVGGGSGVVPLMAMLRAARAAGNPDLVRLLVSVRSPADLYYRDEIGGPQTVVVHTRSAPAGDPRGAGRLTAADLAPLVRG